MSGFSVRSLSHGEMTAFLPRLNEEFIYSRGRRLPLEKRYAGLFAAANASGCFAAFAADGHTPVSFAATEVRQLREGGGQVFLVGAVFTVPEYRGRGLAGEVLKYIAEHYRRLGCAAGYLWTARNGFYERIGWRTFDRSLLMILRAPVPEGDFPAEAWEEGDVCCFVEGGAGGIVRRAEDFDKIPPPADCGIRLKLNGINYLCGGFGRGVGYVYELRAVGSAEARTLLGRFRQTCRCEEIWINFQPEQQSVLMPLTRGGTDFKLIECKLQMNLVFPDVREKALRELTIPYLDRI